ncbi:MAG TPA: M20/M25/M40 family metallo-hydrolase [Anaerolineae bacterium]|nr:M20/M25/M40 family metallo-hydrolase [Anaerolineae bacterium]HIP73890.1 M20/M25/M40 family metallo-hydrolase [Anaerolineae bacterium]
MDTRMERIRRIFTDKQKGIVRLLFAVSLFAITGCSVLKAPETPPTPTLLPTAVPWQLDQPAPAGTVVDPVSDVVPAVDPLIENLVNAVSQQQLMAYVQTLQSFGTRNSFSPTDDPNFGIGAAREWIFDEFTRVGNGRLQVERQPFPLVYGNSSAEQMNIIATLPGKANNNQAIVIMAHYDNRPPDAADGETLAPGANDNASGVALLLESARLLSAYEWNQTIIFVALAAEEQGAFGSRNFVQRTFLQGLDVIAAFNYDAVGGRQGIPQSVRLFAVNVQQSPSGEIARYYEYVGGLYLPMFPVRVINGLDREGRFGDQQEFVNAGLPGIRIIESEEDPDLVNSKRDRWELIDYNYLQQVTQLNVAVTATLAGGPTTPEIPLIEAADTPGAYRLRWPVDPQAAGYALSFRPIAQENYPLFRFVRAREAGDVLLTGLDPAVTYAVSMTALDENGRPGHFTPEVIIEGK